MNADKLLPRRPRKEENNGHTKTQEAQKRKGFCCSVVGLRQAGLSLAGDLVVGSGVDLPSYPFGLPCDYVVVSVPRFTAGASLLPRERLQFDGSQSVT